MAIEKELVPGYTAKVDEQGILTLFVITEENTQQFQLSPQAVRSLHNLLRKDVVRKLTGYRHDN